MENFNNYYQDHNGNIHRDIPLGTSPSDAYVRTNMKLKSEIKRLETIIEEKNEAFASELLRLDTAISNINADTSTQLENALNGFNQSMEELSDSVGEELVSVSENLGANLTSDITTVNNRINNIIAHNNDTEGNSELIDIRSDVDGITHNNAGTAVRNQISNANLDISLNSLSLDLQNVSVTSGYAVNGTSGTINAVSSMSATDYIDISVYRGRIINIFSCLSNFAGFAFYDGTKRFIAGASGTSSGNNGLVYYKSFIPIDANYVRFTLLNSHSASPEDYRITISNAAPVPTDGWIDMDENIKRLVEYKDNPTNTICNTSNNPTTANPARCFIVSSLPIEHGIKSFSVSMNSSDINLSFFLCRKISDTQYQVVFQKYLTPDNNCICQINNIQWNTEPLYIGLKGCFQFSRSAPETVTLLCSDTSFVIQNRTIIVSENEDTCGLIGSIEYYTEKDTTIVQHLKNKKIAILGDSITARNGALVWINGIETLTGATVTRCAVGGSKIQGGEGSTSFIQRYTSIPQDTDIIIVEGGTNDWGNNGMLGSMNYTYSQHNFYGALMTLFKGLQDNYPNAKIYVCTPPHRSDEGNNGTALNNHSVPWSFADCQTAIKNMAQMWGLEIIDLYNELGWCPNNIEHYTEDGLHPNEAGYKRMVSVVCRHINHSMYEFS